MDPLETMVECVMPRLSPCGARAVQALVASRGFLGGADSFARSLGLRNRDQLRRVLAADGLPCLEDLAGWIRVLGWALDCERSGVALSHSALRIGKDPCSCYRTAKRLTGRTWGEIRMLGADWVLMQFARLIAGEGRTPGRTGTMPARASADGRLFLSLIALYSAFA